MRLTGDDHKRRPSWVTAVLIFAVLIALIQIIGRQNPPRLQQEFTTAPPGADAGQIPIPAVPTGIADLARTTTARIMGGKSSAPINQAGRNDTLNVRINSIEKRGENLRLAGSVTNIGAAPVQVSLDAFKFVDGAGTVYASSGSPSTTLQAGQQAPLDITLPIPNPTQLKLVIDKPGQPKIEIVLLNTAPTPRK